MMENIWFKAMYINSWQQEMILQARRERLAQQITPGSTGSPSSLSSLSKYLDWPWKKHPPSFQTHQVSSRVQRE